MAANRKQPQEDAEIEERPLYADMIDIEDVGSGKPARLPQSRVQAKARKLSPYFCFTKEHREAAKAALLAAGQSASVGDMGKKLGQMWRDLSEEERASYSRQEEPATDKDAATRDEEVRGDLAPAGRERGEVTGLPLTKIRRLIKIDPEIKQVNAEAVLLIEGATELFLQLMAEGACEFARGAKRSTIKFDDVARVVRTKRRFRDCVGDDLEEMKREMDAERGLNASTGSGHAKGAGVTEERERGSNEEGDQDGRGEGQGKEKQLERSAEIKKGKQPLHDFSKNNQKLPTNLAKGTRSITDFFKK